MNVARIAKALGGEVVSLNSVLVPGPGHSRRDRSLSIRFHPRCPWRDETTGQIERVPVLIADGIALENTVPDRHYTTCPQCSKDRRKARDGGEL